MGVDIAFIGDSNTNGYPRCIFEESNAPAYVEILERTRDVKHCVIARCNLTYSDYLVFGFILRAQHSLSVTLKKNPQICAPTRGARRQLDLGQIPECRRGEKRTSYKYDQLGIQWRPRASLVK